MFERNTRGFKPTEEARHLLPLAEALESAAFEFSAKSKDIVSIKPIRITAYSGNFSPRMTEIVNDASAMNPDVIFDFSAR